MSYIEIIEKLSYGPNDILIIKTKVHATLQLHDAVNEKLKSCATQPALVLFMKVDESLDKLDKNTAKRILERIINSEVYRAS